MRSWRIRSLGRLTDTSPWSHSGSTTAIGRQALERPPEQPEPVPAGVAGHLAQQPDAGRRPGRRGSSAWGSATAAVRWKTVRCAACSATAGMNWAALAPVPMMATRLPVRSTSWSHSAEWKRLAGEAVAARRCSGQSGRLSWPTALTDRLPAGLVVAARRRCAGVQAWASSSQVGPATSVPKRTCSRRPKRSRQAGSSPAARAGWRSTAASRRSGRTSSCRGGWGRPPGSPGRCSRTRCRRPRRSSRRS